MNISKASEPQVSEFIEENKQWSLVNNQLHREFIFNNFVSAFGFMTQAALIAERLNHHPEWSNVYKKVVVNLTTHEVNGISFRDFQLAKEMDIIAAKIS